ncbi:MAG: peptidase, partial [Rhodospirillales bacterium]|nr:peptidase [Rhodospirillales bacterium]
LEAAAAAFNPAVSSAPIVIGHPEQTAPAFGWIKGLSFTDGALVAETDQVDPQFSELVKNGRFKTRSASFYPPDSSANPVPGTYYLQHVAFLGAAAPAVKGLTPVEFAGAGEDTVTVQFGEYEDKTIGRLFRNLRDNLIETLGLEKADNILPSWSVDSLQEEAGVPDQPAPMFSEPAPQPQPQEDTMNTPQEDKAAAEAATKFAEEQAVLSAGKETLDKDKAEFAEQKRTADAATAIDGLVKDGRVLPAEKDGLAKFMAGLEGTDTVQFAEGDDNKKTPLAFFTGFLETMPKRVDFSERSGGEIENGSPGFKAPAGFAVDPVALETHNKALAFMEGHADSKYADAVVAVSTINSH